MANLTETYSPPWAPHVVGRYEPFVRDQETGAAEEQRFQIECGICGEKLLGTCNTGMVQQRIARLALLHKHRDAFDPVPGSNVIDGAPMRKR